MKADTDIFSLKLLKPYTLVPVVHIVCLTKMIIFMSDPPPHQPGCLCSKMFPDSSHQLSGLPRVCSVKNLQNIYYRVG